MEGVLDICDDMGEWDNDICDIAVWGYKNI
jgi:hypothetical protein